MVMASLRPDYRLHDVRLRERLLAAGVITSEDVEKFLASLPNVEAEAEESPVRLHERDHKSVNAGAQAD